MVDGADDLIHFLLRDAVFLDLLTQIVFKRVSAALFVCSFGENLMPVSVVDTDLFAACVHDFRHFVRVFGLRAVPHSRPDALGVEPAEVGLHVGLHAVNELRGLGGMRRPPEDFPHAVEELRNVLFDLRKDVRFLVAQIVRHGVPEFRIAQALHRSVGYDLVLRLAPADLLAFTLVLADLRLDHALQGQLGVPGAHDCLQYGLLVRQILRRRVLLHPVGQLVA